MSDRGGTAGTVGAFRLVGVPVRLHFTFVLLTIFLLVTDLGHESSVSFALFLLGLFASVLLHEMAHAAMASRFQVRTIEIVMFPIGGVSRLERRLGPFEELCIAGVGPLVNLAISAAIFVYISIAGTGIAIDPMALLEPSDGNVVQRLAFANLLLAGFNLMPAFPMDGGRILRALLSLIRPEAEATRSAAWMGRMLAISMGIYGLVNSELLLVFFAFFIWLGAAQESAAALGRILTDGVPVRAAMVTEFYRLQHGDTVREAADLLLSTSQHDFPVMHGTEVIGLLDRDRLMQALATYGPDAYVAGVMNRDYVAMAAEADLAEELPLMARSGRCALVMEGEELVGLLTADNLSEFLLLRRFGMEPSA